MGEYNRGQTIFLSVIGIATLLVAIIGATFAYFTTTMTGTPANVGATAASLSSLSFEAQSVDSDNKEIYPGWKSADKTVTITMAANSSLETEYDVAYTCYLNITGESNPLSDLIVTVSDANGVTLDPTASAGAAVTGQKVTLATGTITATKAGSSQSFKYNIELPELGDEQNDQQGMTFDGTVSCVMDNTNIYFNQEHQTGTTSKPANTRG